MNSCSKGGGFFSLPPPPPSCFGSLLWSVFSSLLLLDLVLNLICSRGVRVSEGACLDAGKCITAALASNLGDFCFVLSDGLHQSVVRCWWRQACGSPVNSKGPNETFCSRESWLSGLVSKAKCFFRPRYKDNLSQLPFSHTLPFSFAG